MNERNRLQDSDTKLVEGCLAHPPETESVAGFLPGEGIYRLELKFDIEQLRQALEACVADPCRNTLRPTTGFLPTCELARFTG